MKSAIIWIFSILCVLNLVGGYIFSSIEGVNVVMSTVVIVLTALLLLIGTHKTIRVGFQVFIILTCLAIGFAQYIAAIYMRPYLHNNMLLMLVICGFAIDIVLILIAATTSKKIK